MAPLCHVINKGLIRFAPLLAAIVFGGWAAFVNSEYGLVVSVRSGLGQAAYALFSTWIITITATNVFAFFGSSAAGFLVGFAASFLVMISIPLTIHHALGTPEIFNAILPGLLWGSGFISTYLWILSRSAQTIKVGSVSS